MSSCANCLKVILENGVSYSINPDSVCKCEKPMPIHSTATVVTTPNTQPSSRKEYTLRRKILDAVMPPSEHPTFGTMQLGDGIGWYQSNEMTITGSFKGSADRLEALFKAQRQSDLKKLSFHFAIPVEDLEKALQSKERV